MIDPIPAGSPDEQRLAEKVERYTKVLRAGPTWAMLVEVFGAESLWVRDRTFGLLTRGSVNADGTVYPKGEVCFQICHERYSPEMNKKRLRVFNEMMRDKRLMQTEDTEKRDAETEHARWKDLDGVTRIAPAEFEDMLRKRDEDRKKEPPVGQ